MPGVNVAVSECLFQRHLALAAEPRWERRGF
jgi:hypothetical protein